ncbi:MAG: EamA family transporter [Lachnospiraceae bacterium]|nr:EamA family transporter [Lachnospiraceae bacterium]
MNERIKGIIYMLLAAVALSLAGLFVKLAVWDSFGITGGRSVATLAACVIYMVLTGKKFVFNKPVLFGGVCISLLNFLFIFATQSTSAANAIVLEYTEPFFVILLLWLIFGQRPQKAEIVAVLAAFAGIVFFFMDKLTPGGMIGNFAALMAGLVYAVFILVKKMDGNDFFSSVLTAAVINIIVCGWTIPGQTNWEPVGVLMVALFGIVPCFLGYILLSAGLDRMPIVAGVLLSMLEPVLNPIWVAVFYGEVVGKMSLIGMVIILGTAAIYSVWQIKNTA